MDKEELLKLIEDDDLDLLKTKPKFSSNTADERLIASFQEITEFVRKNQRPPEASKDIQEFRLYSRLKGFNEDPEKLAALSQYDEFSVLKPSKPIQSVEDIFEDDELGLFDEGPDSIFTLKHIPKEAPDYIAQRKPCKDFAQFEALFQQCQAELASGKRKLFPFESENQIEQGKFFVLKGVMVYIAEVGEKIEKNRLTDARLYSIFENGTESDMLLRSLASQLHRDGLKVGFSNEEEERQLYETFNQITDEDQEAGYIYIVRSLSQKTEIATMKNLYKIGFSRQPVETRLKNAEQEPTYLMAPVSLIACYKCFNLKPQKLELFLHIFFAESCLNLDVYDGQGKRHLPREWFVAPLEVIEKAIQLLINGEIINYKYDLTKQEIILK